MGGIGDTLKKAKLLNMTKNLSVEGLMGLYQKNLEAAYKGIENVETELEDAKKLGDAAKIKKLDKRLKKMKKLTESVDKGIAEGVMGFGDKVRI